ncbi:hypothetical protein [Catelliglobosispora koreensis]|uniref:hypothetical protein n=1 Tax=Catelliglobosispora koreensis TaxID=129052 RepID=UPI00037D9D34|nr:hypothetical protein [Catelliglobosispora koreensis]
MLTVVVVAVAGLLAVPSAAMADSYACTYGPGAYNCEGRAEFVSHGEHFYLMDRKADGHSAVLRYYRADTQQWKTSWNHDGAGTTKHINLDMPEGYDVVYYVCLGEYGDRDILEETCGVPTYGDMS